MAKLTLTDTSSGYELTTTVNDNNAAIEAAVEKQLSRDGTSPNQMEAELDMNGYAINNLPTATSNTQPVTLAQAASIAGVDNPLSQENVGDVLWPETSAETSAGVTPTNNHYPPGNVLRYGAAADGETNDSAAFQDAIDSGHEVYVPSGDYALDAKLTVATNTRIRGDGVGVTKLIKNADVTSGHGLIYANSGGSSTYLYNIQISDLEIDGLTYEAGKGFSEFQHLIALSGVDGVFISNVKLTGPQGDGIYLGSQDGERHNKNVVISNCIFDGVDQENRNAISIIDGENVSIANCAFYDFTKSTMPGAIDVEPNSNTYHIVRNISISNCTFDNIGGNVAVISFVFNQATFTNQPEGFSVTGCTFDVTADAFAILNNATGYGRPLNIAISGNSGKCDDFIDCGDYIEGLAFTNNTFRITGRGYFTFDATDGIRDLTFTGNVITGENSTAKGLVLRSGEGIVISDNVFRKITDYCVLIGGTGATIGNILITDNMVRNSDAGVEFSSGTITNVGITNNDLRGATSPIEGTVPSDTRIRGNYGYISENGGATGSIATGATVAHGLSATPDIISITPTTSTPTNIYVNAVGSTNFTVNYTGGGTHNFLWEAKLVENFGD